MIPGSQAISGGLYWQVGRRCSRPFGPDFYARTGYRTATGAKQEQTGNVPRPRPTPCLCWALLGGRCQKQVLGTFRALSVMTSCITCGARCAR